MPYISGGYANAEIENDFVSGGARCASASDRFNGWYIGGGVDMFITGNWKIGVDYRHYEFEDVDITPTADNGAPLPGERSTFSPTADAVTARLSYVFGGAERGAGTFEVGHQLAAGMCMALHRSSSAVEKDAAGSSQTLRPVVVGVKPERLGPPDRDAPRP